MVLDLRIIVKMRIENSHLPHTQSPLLLIHFSVIYLSQLMNHTGTLLLNKLHILFRFP